MRHEWKLGALRLEGNVVGCESLAIVRDMKLNSLIILQNRPANQLEIEKKFIRLLLEQWDGQGCFIEYLTITLPVMWEGYVRLN